MIQSVSTSNKAAALLEAIMRTQSEEIENLWSLVPEPLRSKVEANYTGVLEKYDGSGVEISGLRRADESLPDSPDNDESGDE